MSICVIYLFIYVSHYESPTGTFYTKMQPQSNLLGFFALENFELQKLKQHAYRHAGLWQLKTQKPKICIVILWDFSGVIQWDPLLRGIKLDADQNVG